MLAPSSSSTLTFRDLVIAYSVGLHTRSTSAVAFKPRMEAQRDAWTAGRPKVALTRSGVLVSDSFVPDSFVPPQATLARSVLPMNSAPSLFPPPPTLADMVRMRPDLTLQEAAGRACCQHAVPFIDCESNSETITRYRNECLRKCHNDSPAISVTVEDTSPQVSGLNSGSVSSSGSSGPTFSDILSSEPTTTSQAFRSPPRPKTSGLVQEVADPFTTAPWITDLLLLQLLEEKNRNLVSEETKESYIEQLPAVRRQVSDRIGHVIKFARITKANALLALWYSARLSFQFGFSLACHDYGLDLVELVFNTYLAGLILAKMWTTDAEYRSSYWSSLSGLPCKTVNYLRTAAFVELEYNIAVLDNAWVDWLERVLLDHRRSACSDPVVPGHISRYIAMEYTLQEALAVSYGIDFPKAHATQRHISLVETLLDEEPKRWCPEEDPIVPKAARQPTVAPGSTKDRLPVIGISSIYTELSFI